MTRDQALAKIRKCLALGKSENPNEAAIAMRQAQALMTEHLITPDDVTLADIKKVACSTRTNSSPLWEVALANMIATSFGCAATWIRTMGFTQSCNVAYKRSVIFYGVGTTPDIAGYAWDVLSVQCAKGRLAHIREQSKRCKPITRTARGDEYAMGWVRGVSLKLDKFSTPESTKLLLEQFSAVTWPAMKTTEAKDRTKGRNVSLNDFHKGRIAGTQATLNHGVDGRSTQTLLAGKAP